MENCTPSEHQSHNRTFCRVGKCSKSLHLSFSLSPKWVKDPIMGEIKRRPLLLFIPPAWPGLHITLSMFLMSMSCVVGSVYRDNPWWYFQRTLKNWRLGSGSSFQVSYLLQTVLITRLSKSPITLGVFHTLSSNSPSLSKFSDSTTPSPSSSLSAHLHKNAFKTGDPPSARESNHSCTEGFYRSYPVTIEPITRPGKVYIKHSCKRRKN